jgi:hypothetical protein
MTGPKRRELITADIVARTGITEAMIERLVRSFYDKVREDEMLGPVFDARITDWEPHLAQMCAFWSSVALMSGRYHGAPMPGICRCLSMPRISTAGSRCSKSPPARSVRPRRKRISWSARSGSRRASSSALPVRMASCLASARDSAAPGRQSPHEALRVRSTARPAQREQPAVGFLDACVDEDCHRVHQRHRHLQRPGDEPDREIDQPKADAGER